MGWQTKDEFKKEFIESVHGLWGKDIKSLSNQEVYQTVAWMIRTLVTERWIKTNGEYDKKNAKQVYYFSIEFLLGRLLKSNLDSCDIEGVCREGLKEMGWDLEVIIPEEPDPGLGNGGLGRLAACFIDSLAALQMPGHGCSIRYQYGLFEQRIMDGQQVELPDNWLHDGFPWEIKKADKAVDVHFGGNAYMRPDENGNLECIHEAYTTIHAVPYDVPVIGYHNDKVNTLRLWKSEYSGEGLEGQNPVHSSQELQYRNALQRISMFLYPDDSTYEGRQLRLMQEYFLASAGLQSIVNHYRKRHQSLNHFDKYVALHINDTHPALLVPELMRILVDEENMSWDKAWKITKNTIAYTNHTVLPEAMECWPIPMFKSLLPRIYMIVEEIHKRWMEEVDHRYPGDMAKASRLAILWDGQVHMAPLSILGSHSVNGVAEIHTELLKSTVLHDFYQWFPQRFNNKTNGVTPRRWLMVANPQLSSLIDESIGTQWRQSASRLKELEAYAKDSAFQDKLDKVKLERKKILARFIEDKYSVSLDTSSIFDIQIKRIHMYKRQLLNILQVYKMYLELRANPNMDFVPRTFIFGGKAAASYGEAKMTIKLINQVANTIAKDPMAKDKLKVIFLENYNVSLGQLLFPAANVSEQISTAGKEASGTGNMKFMMNGAITLGTLDGANVEINRIVGNKHSVIFGLRAEEVADYYKFGGYSSWDLYRSDPIIKELMILLGSNPDYQALYSDLLDRNDEYFVLKDFEAYCQAQKEIEARYKDRAGWLESSAVNIAKSGYFSSDRTIKEYADEIWKIKPVK